MQFFIHITLQLILIVLFVTDFNLNRKLKKTDTTIKCVRTSSQNLQRLLNYGCLILSIISPFDTIYLLIPILSIIYFFILTDREIMIGKHQLYLRGQAYDINKIRDLSFENNRLCFTYSREHISLKHPLVDREFLNEKLIQVVNRKQNKTHHQKKN